MTTSVPRGNRAHLVLRQIAHVGSRRGLFAPATVRQALPKIHQPILIFRAGVMLSAIRRRAEVYDRVASQDKELVWLEHSGHNLWPMASASRSGTEL